MSCQRIPEREGGNGTSQITHKICEEENHSNSGSKVNHQDFHRELVLWSLNRCLLVFSAGTQTLE